MRDDYDGVFAPDRWVLEPQQTAQDVVIMLHGLGARAEDFEILPAALDWPRDWPVRWVLPQAPDMSVTANQGWIMPSWFDMTTLDEHMRVDVSDLLSQCDWLWSHIQEQIDLGIAPHRIVIAGFSQGGALALWAGLTRDIALGGVGVLSGFLPEPEAWREHVDASCRDVPVAFFHGRADDVVYPGWAEVAHEHVQAVQEGDVLFYWYDHDHAFCGEELLAWKQWLQQCLRPVA